MLFIENIKIVPSSAILLSRDGITNDESGFPPDTDG